MKAIIVSILQNLIENFKRFMTFLIITIILWVNSCARGESNSGQSELTDSTYKPNLKPNIIVIMVDDMGYSDIGCYGGEIHTSNLDKLAQEGIRFSQFYNYARCCPTRASLLTGLYPHQTGIGYMTSENRSTLATNQRIASPKYQGYLNNNCVTIAEALQSAGYQTFMTGKWHVGTYRPNWPMDRGFDKYFGIIRGAANYFKPEPEKLLLLNDEPFTITSNDFYTTDAFSDYAVKFIEEADRDRPFFLYVAYNAPHWPLHAWSEDIIKYKGKYMEGWDVLRERRLQRQKDLGLFDKDLRLSPRDIEAPYWKDVTDKEDWDLRMAVYAAMIDRVDQGIGRILEKVREIGEEENTLIMFLSDNGGCAEHYNPEPNIPPGPEESNTGYYLPWANASNTPFRLFKHWVHEGGIATPFIARWPAIIKQKGTITEQVGHVMDIMATCLDIASVEYPKTYRGCEIIALEGKSLLPIFQGKERKGHEVIYWEHEGNRAVRQGKWKLVSYYNESHQYRVGSGKRTGEWELYDMEADRTELHNLANQYPEKVKELSSKYVEWAKSIGIIDWDEIQKKLYNKIKER
jgi:arylsulfatase A-like enzyme